ncbi:MAG: hypothetical protein E6J34_04680 [Chloroflexi bacterium]|nr:MAG: hypothetical protein E6J34_04680 [Chloroflexota bacterium]
MLSLEGKQLGNYDVTRRIRVGGMGAVYEGRQRTAFDRRVAIKVILGNYSNDRDMRRRFMREARTVAQLHHPHILPLIEFGDEQGILYLVMPFIDGGTLTSYLRQTLPDLGEVAAIYQQLLDAVEYAHDEGLIHRDIKSSNVLLEMRRSGPPYVYLADFGLVRIARSATHGLRSDLDDTSKVGKPIPLDQVPGTPHYMAPEQTRGIVTPQTDIYALGVLLYQMLTGELPYNHPDDIRVIQMHMQASIPAPSKHDASIPPEIDEVVRMAMAKRPEARYSTITALRAAFLAAMRGPIAALEEGTSPSSFNSPRLAQTGRRTVPVLPLENEPPPSPLTSRRLRNDLAPLALRDQREMYARQRTTENVPLHLPAPFTRAARHRARVTEEPPPVPARRERNPHGYKKRQTSLPLVIVAVSVLLLIILITPHALGLNLFPADIPLIGASATASVYITPKKTTVQNSYILTASPKVKEADWMTHTLPDRQLQSNASATETTPTTGRQTSGAQQAHGTIEFSNSTNTTISLPAQMTLTNSDGIRIQTTQNVQVPRNQEGQNGKATVPAIAVNAGANGNIAAHTLDGSCCNNGVSVSNPAPFVDGSDGKVIHIVSQADVNNAKDALTLRLEQQIQQNMQQQLQKNERLAKTPIYTVNSTAGPDVGTASDQVQITVTIAATAIAYDYNSATSIVYRLLNQEVQEQKANQKLDQAFQLQDTPTLINEPKIDLGQNGVIYLSISVRGLWVYKLTPEQLTRWIPYIKGASSDASYAYLKTQPGVANVDIRLAFGTDHLPSNVNDIHVLLINN